MRRGGGKQKGSQFEREVCKKLSLWVSYNLQEDVFWRSALSGGRSTVAHAKGKNLGTQAGDISSVSPYGNAFISKFVVECKFYRDLQFVGLLSNKGNLTKFWVEITRQALRYNKLPLMIAKQNQQKPVVCLNREGLKVLTMQLKCVLNAPRQNLYMVPFDDFLRYATRV